MDYKSISAGELAGLLDVQRSNISHILNGRNKPGAAFIEKLLLSFPDLNARWLLTGEGEMVEKKVTTEIKNEIVEKVKKFEEPKKVPEEPLKEEQPKPKKEEKPVSKIVLLYADGTFEDYNKK
jgi:transcriptional regulator with XRE-family HTH domain